MGINQLVDSLKHIVETDLKNWQEDRVKNPGRIIKALNNLALQIKKVSFFNLNYDITILNFLKDFLKSKPDEPKFLIALNDILQAIQSSINTSLIFSKDQIDIVIAYFELLETMRKQELFLREEIAFSAKDLTTLVFVTTQSDPFPRSRFDIYKFLRCSFDIPRFLNNYSDLTQSIFLLARAEKNFLPNFIFKVSDSFSVLGYLGRLLHYYDSNSAFNYDLQHGLKEIDHDAFNLYDFYKPLMEKDLIKKDLFDYIFAKKYVGELSRDKPNTNLTQVCARDYTNHCNLDYQHFNSKFTCPERSLTDCNIQIAHSYLTERELIRICNDMHNAGIEFNDLFKKMQRQPQNKLRFLLNISPNQADFRYVTKLFESYNAEDYVGGVYFPKSERNGQLPAAYARENSQGIIVHEYIHYRFFENINRGWDYKMLTEGVPELFAGGVCHPWHLSSLKEYVNDTEILTSLEKRNFSGYFNAYKWSAFLINQKLNLIKQLLTSYDKGNQTEFNNALDQFLNDPVERKGFLDWAQLQNQVCSDYSKQYPDSEKSSIYLADVRRLLAIRTDSSITKPTTKSIKILPDKNFYKDAKDPNTLAHNIVLAIASQDGNRVQQIEALLNKGANAKWQDSRTGNTLLHFLFYYNVYSYEITCLLLKYGADVKTCNHNQVTAYEIGKREQLKFEIQQRDLVGDQNALAENINIIQAIRSMNSLFEQALRLSKNLISSTAYPPTTTVHQPPSISRGLVYFTKITTTPIPNYSKKLTSPTATVPLASSLSSTSVYSRSKPTSGIPSSSMEVAIYEKPAYEFHIMINVSLSLAKGVVTAINRYGFEKFMQKHKSYLRRHPYLILLFRNLIEAASLSAINLICFPTTKGIVGNYNELGSAGIYFAMDMTTSFGFGLLNAKIQPFFNARKDSWIKYLENNVSLKGLRSLCFYIMINISLGFAKLSSNVIYALIGNASIFIGKEFENNKSEIFLSVILNSLLMAIIHEVTYQGFNYADNCLFSKKNAEPEQTSSQASASKQVFYSKKTKLPKKPPFSVVEEKNKVEDNESNTQEHLLPNGVKYPVLNQASFQLPVSKQVFYSKKTKLPKKPPFSVVEEKNKVEDNESNTQEHLLPNGVKYPVLNQASFQLPVSKQVFYSKKTKLPKKPMFSVVEQKNKVEDNESNTQQHLLPNGVKYPVLSQATFQLPVSKQDFYFKKSKSPKKPLHNIRDVKDNSKENEGDSQQHLLAQRERYVSSSHV